MPSVVPFARIITGMLRHIDLRGRQLSPDQLAKCLPRAGLDVAGALQQVAPLIADVRTRGAAAVAEYSERFDHVRPSRLRVPQHVVDEALNDLDPTLREALEIAIVRNRAGHEAQLPSERSTEITPGGHVHQRWVPVNRVGLYVPGGRAVYPSSVIMNVVAAQVAGVASLAVTSPPQPHHGGWPHPTVLATCALVGATEIYAAGGAQAIAMLAYGLSGPGEGELCPPVDVVTGPGNVYLAAAKRAVSGDVGIDAEAGTTEIAVMADASADADIVAADLVSQAEHDPAAAAVLITTSPELAEAVEGRTEARARATRHTQRVQEALSGPQSGIVLVEDIEQAIAVANAYAAEHLSIQTQHPDEVADQVRNAGAVFLGPCSPVSLGDYLAGSNHVLPTGGTARFAAGLNVMTYLKAMQVVDYDGGALAGAAEPLRHIAECEGLPAHAAAVDARLQH